MRVVVFGERWKVSKICVVHLVQRFSCSVQHWKVAAVALAVHNGSYCTSEFCKALHPEV